MKETFDPNRPYNRTEINKEFDRVKAKMHKKALAKGKAKYVLAFKNRALF